MKDDFQKAANAFLQSEQGNRLKDFAASPQGQQLRRQHAQAGQQLQQAVQSGDMARAELILKQFLASSDGKKLTETVQDLLN